MRRKECGNRGRVRTLDGRRGLAFSLGILPADVPRQPSRFRKVSAVAGSGPGAPILHRHGVLLRIR